MLRLTVINQVRLVITVKTITSHERIRDISDSDSHHDDRDTRYRKRRSSLDARTPYYEPRQRRRGKGRRRRSRPHTNSYDVDKSRPSSVTPKKGIGLCNLPTGVDSILLPQTTSISTTSAASPNTVRTTVIICPDILNTDELRHREMEQQHNGVTFPWHPP